MRKTTEEIYEMKWKCVDGGRRVKESSWGVERTPSVDHARDSNLLKHKICVRSDKSDRKYSDVQAKKE